MSLLLLWHNRHGFLNSPPTAVMTTQVAVGNLVMLLLGSVVNADVRLPPFLSDRMVLHREMKVPIWGWADIGEKIVVAFVGQEKTSTADKAGKWIVTLDPLYRSRV